MRRSRMRYEILIELKNDMMKALYHLSYFLGNVLEYLNTLSRVARREEQT